MANNHKVPAINAFRRTLIEGVKNYGRRNYDRNGWDYVIECWTDDDINNVIGIRTKSVLGAIQMMVQYGGFKELSGYRRDVQAESDALLLTYDPIPEAFGIAVFEEDEPKQETLKEAHKKAA